MQYPSVFLVAMSLSSALATAQADASCNDRPGTPTNVTAQVNTKFNIRPQIIVTWINKGNNDETLWWDVEVTDEAGNFPPPQPRPGSGRPGTSRDQMIENEYDTQPNVTRCYRVKARTEPGTEGCVSLLWSNRACVTTFSEIRSGVGKCLDVVASDQRNNGAQVQVWDCNNGIQQRWTSFLNNINSGEGKCLDVNAPDQDKNGAKVQVWDCNNGPVLASPSTQQTWTIEGRSIRSGKGKCLDVVASDQRNNGAKVQVWDCNNTIQQTWILR